MMESIQGVAAAIAMLLVATVIMSAFYGVPYLIWKGFNKLTKLWNQHATRKRGGS